MVALVHNDVAVVGDHIVHDLLSIQTLDDCNVNQPAGTPASTANLPDALDGQIQKCREPLAPLIEKLAAMDEHQSVHLPRRNQLGGHDRFAEGGCCAQDAVIVGKHGVGCGLLVGAKLAVKHHVNRLTGESLVVEFHGDLVRFE